MVSSGFAAAMQLRPEIGANHEMHVNVSREYENSGRLIIGACDAYEAVSRRALSTRKAIIHLDPPPGTSSS